MGTLMRVEDVRAYYETGAGVVRAVDGVSLAVNGSEVLGIVGESGCGKSTLASVLALSVRHPLRVKSGVMVFDGRVIRLAEQARLPRTWRGKLIALLPQGAMNSLNPTARVRDLAVDVMRAHEPDMSRQEAIERARQRLEQLSLPARVLDSYPHQLSGGMRQRAVAVISTLLNPTVLIADEPTSALDVSSQRALIGLLLELLDRGFIGSIVFITHDLPLLSNVADRIAVMYAGLVVESAAMEEALEHPQHPYTRALVASTLVPEPYVRRYRIEGIKGSPPDLRSPPSGCRFHPRCPLAMEICGREEPPQVRTGERLTACWWVFERRKITAVEGQTGDSGATAGTPA